MKLLSQCQGLLRSGRQTSGPELFMTVQKSTRGGEENGPNRRRRRPAHPRDSWYNRTTEPRSSDVMRSRPEHWAWPVASTWSQEGGHGTRSLTGFCHFIQWHRVWSCNKQPCTFAKHFALFFLWLINCFVTVIEISTLFVCFCLESSHFINSSLTRILLILTQNMLR